MKYYKVTVTQIETDVPFRDKEYQIVGNDEDGENKYDYVWFDSTREEKKDIYEQTVNELDVAKLVDVVNEANRSK